MTWSTAPLKELVEHDGGMIQTGPFGSQLHQSDYVTEGIPVIMPKDIADGRASPDSVARVSEKTATRLSRHRLRPRTILLPRRGEITKRAFVREDQTGWLCGTGCLQIVVGDKTLVPEFLYYYLELPHVVRWLEQHAVGTTMLNLSANIVAALPIRYPPWSAQERIASILSAYDDLIKNNGRRIELLEDAARQLYRQWFVRLRFPGSEHTIQSNGVPDGWSRRRIGDVAECVGGGTPSTANPSYWEGGDIPWVTPTDVTRNRHLVLIGTERKITTAGMKSSSARRVPPHTVLMTSRASVGFFAVAQREVCTNQGFISIVPTTQELSPYLLFHLSDRVEEIRSMGSGSTYPEVSRAKMREFPVLVPEQPLLRRFAKHVGPILSQIRMLKHQGQQLRAARDLLLPRLMSGEISV